MESINTKKLIGSLYNVYSMLNEENTKSLDELVDVIRNMELVDLINGTDSVCVAGMQGAGKTTLIKNLYGFPDDLLIISDERGERVPVFIREDNSLFEGEYRAKHVYLDKFNGEKITENINIEDVKSLCRKKNNTVCLELTTAPKYFSSNDGAFILLPGFEKSDLEKFDENYNAIINCCLHFSKAVLFVTDNHTTANSDSNYLIDNLKAHGFNGKNAVFAITKIDSNVNPDFGKEVKESLKNVLKSRDFDADDGRIIICDYKTEAWKEKLINAVSDNAVVPFVEKKKTYLMPMVKKILRLVNNIETDLKDISNGIELNKSDSPIAEELQIQLQKSREKIEKMINDAIENASLETDENIESAFEDPEMKKLLKEKHFGIIRKKLTTINQNNEKFRETLSACIRTEDEKNILHTKIVENLSVENLERYDIPCLTSSSYNSTLALCASYNKELEPADITEENVRKGDELVASFFTKDFVAVKDDAGNPLAASNKNVAKMITSSFNSSFVTFYIGAELLEAEMCERIMTECNGALSTAVKNYNRKQKNDFLGKSALITGLDVIDGKLDIIGAASEIGEKVRAVLAGSAGPYIGLASAAVAVTCGGAISHNNNVKIEHATQESAKRAVRNQMYSQRDTILEKYDEGADKLLDLLNDVHNAKNNYDDEESRIRNANYAIQGIKSMCQSVCDEYAKTIGG